MTGPAEGEAAAMAGAWSDRAVSSRRALPAVALLALLALAASGVVVAVVAPGPVLLDLGGP